MCMRNRLTDDHEKHRQPHAIPSPHYTSARRDTHAGSWCPARSAARARLLPSGSDSEERLSWQKQISKQPSQAVRRRLSFSPPLSYNFIPSLAISFCPYGASSERERASGAACVYYCERGGGSLSVCAFRARQLNPEKSKRLRRGAGKQRSPRRRGRGEKTLFTLIFARGAATTIPSLCLFFSLGMRPPLAPSTALF